MFDEQKKSKSLTPIVISNLSLLLGKTKILDKINCKINYFNNLELKEIRNNLNNISVIQSLNIKSLSFKNIEYDINYYGNLNILINIFKMNKLDINNLKNQCIIRLK